MSDFEKMLAKQMEQPINAALETLPKEQMMRSAQAAAQALAETLRVTVIPNNEKLMDSVRVLGEEMSRTMAEINKDSLARISAAILETVHTIPPDATVSVEEATAAVEEIRPYLPEKAAKKVESEIQKAQTTDHKISGEVLREILEIFVVPLLLLFVGNFLESEHDQKEEAFWLAMSESRQEEIALEEQDIALEQEILEYLKRLPEFSMEAGQAPDSVRNQDQSINDSVDSQVDSDNQNPAHDFLQEQPDVKN